jgi:sensor histidine kinase YesM
MTLHDFIFSEKKRTRYCRHIVFWLTRYIYIAFSRHDEHIGSVFWNEFLISNFFTLITEMAFTYVVVYVLFPNYLVQKKYIPFITVLSGLTIIAYMVTGLIVFRELAHSGQTRDMLFLILLEHTRSFFVAGPPVVCGFFITIKMLKTWYKETQQKQTLLKENEEAELQLLKAQVHPHFLFNTLNNIYSFTINQSPQAPKLVLSLSDILHYMITECEPVLVPLAKEIKMILNYTNLERIRYGNRLELQVNIQEGYENKAIAPLLMIPFIENSFKHGASQVLQHPWIKLNIWVEENLLRLELSNNKPYRVTPNEGKKGIGLGNVQKRLELLYPGQYLLKIDADAETFVVCMHVPLENMNKMDSGNSREKVPLSAKLISYAE